MLQRHSILKAIKKKLIRKALDMIRKLAEEDPDESNDKDKEDPVDVYLMKYLVDYEDKELKESYKELTKWWKSALASYDVDDVKLSIRLADTPCVAVTSNFGWSANMEKIMQSQILSDASKQAYMRGKRILEINPRHPIIKELQ
ncbi:unnamed protein product [Prunus armeniaca]|uniref:Uncharacterized protein n=1 Tax=Prunus armeniaca TaxID=36596 RepID=A0A6J5V2I8_PRUAR|nr:unnamed protein product [Prunus armeniaca]CAB4311866.1 unnamed protein product [Prunus armeniaca]